jgi:hypothetical protein
MDRQNRAPLKLLLPIETTTPTEQATSTDPEPAAPTPAESIEVSPVHSSPDAPRPRFVPLALAIDMGQTGPIGSLTTTTVEIERSPAPPRSQPKVGPQPSVRPLAGARSAAAGRRHLRLLPDP